VRVLCESSSPAILAALIAMALSGCVHTDSPVAVAQPRSDLDAMAYGPLPEQAHVAANSSGGGAIEALRGSFATASLRAAPESSAVYAGPRMVAVAGLAAPAYDAAYHLDTGDKLRVVIYGQEGLTNTYAIDASGMITMPLIGRVPARGRTPAGLAAEIATKLRDGYIREPSVAVEVESYRPFFILGEVAAPGQYPYVPNMTVESAVAIAGGFSPRARRDTVTVTHTDATGAARFVVPLGTSIGPGDTVQVGERWF
jgi:polysaccharide export outer membrane protein